MITYNEKENKNGTATLGFLRENSEKIFLVPVDIYNNYTIDKLRPVEKRELDCILKFYAGEILDIVGRGQKGFMTMWACFQERLKSGNYEDLDNAYSMLISDNKRLYERERELRNLWKQYEELWQIRHFTTVEDYYKYKAEQAKNRYEPMIDRFNDEWGIKNQDEK